MQGFKDYPEEFAVAARTPQTAPPNHRGRRRTTGSLRADLVSQGHSMVNQRPAEAHCRRRRRRTWSSRGIPIDCMNPPSRSTTKSLAQCLSRVTLSIQAFGSGRDGGLRSSEDHGRAV